jgi:hypothetical protein
MASIVKELASKKEDLVFVGSMVNIANRKKHDAPNDLDIVITSVDGLETFGEVIIEETESIHSKSGKRSQIVYNGIQIDIFIEDELPPYDVINGIKFAKVDYMISRYTELLSKTDSAEMKSIIQSKIDGLK